MEESLNKIYDEMIERLYKPLIFYIPRRIWNQFDKDKWNAKMFDEVFDKVVLIKPDGQDIILNNEPSNFHIMFKVARLDKNTFKLLDIQKKTDSNQFDFLLNRYCVQLDFYRRVSKWMAENIQKDVKDNNEETLFSFEIQQSTFSKHWQYIQDTFVNGLKIEETKADSNLTNKDFKSLQDLMNQSSILPKAEAPESINENDTNIIKKPKKIKKVLLTEEEAERFLLRTVFHINS